MRYNPKQLHTFLVEENSGTRVSPAEMLYYFYIHHTPPEPDSLRTYHKAVNQLVEHLPFVEQDRILCAVNTLCAEYERITLLNGIHLGAQLVSELMSET